MSDPTTPTDDFGSESVDVTPDAGAGHATQPSAVPVFETKRHPFRGFFAAIPLAIGVVIILLVTKTIELSLTPMIAVFVIVLVLGTLWGAFGPASKPTSMPPAEPTPPNAPGEAQFRAPGPTTHDDPPPPPTDWSAPSS